jgi:hypothetical protein
MTDEIKELKKQVEELKKENTELQRELSVHNFLDTGVPQERLDYQRELKKEIIRLKSLNRRAADEIRDLDDTIIKITKEFPEVREFLGWKDDDLWAGEASINLLNRLDGRTSGGYVENYDDLHLEMKTLDGYAHACDCGIFDKESEEGCIPWSCDACGSPCKKSLGPEGYCDTCRPIMLNGGNTPERVEEQIEWLKKVAEQKEINKMVDQVESAAVKAAHKVMEQHSEAFEKLEENKE